MSMIHDLGEDYRHYRSEHPGLRWLFLLGDLIGLSVKLAVVAGFFYACWHVISRNPPPEQQTAEVTQSAPAVKTPELTSQRIAVLKEIASQSGATESQLVGSAESSTADLNAPSAVGQVITLESVDTAVQVEGSTATSGYVEVDEIPTVFSASTDTEEEFFNPPAPTENSDWVLSQRAGDYTVKLALTVNVDFLVQYARRLPKEYVSAIYPERRTESGNLQYSLSLGSFPDLQSAEQALASLPKNLKRYGAHTSSFDDVQKNMNRLKRR